ncbi:MAG: signal peptidase II [Acidimicrobiales bacterium]
MQERRARPPLSSVRTARATVNRRHAGLAATVAAAVLAADQLTKWWALTTLDDDPVVLFWTLRLRLTFNTGTAFSLGAGRGGLVALLAIAVVAAMVWIGRSISSRLGGVALGLVLGGAVGNLTDRVFRADDGLLSGAVVDFVDLQWWPVFNLADAAIVCGAVLLLVSSAREPREGDDRGDQGDQADGSQK